MLQPEPGQVAYFPVVDAIEEFRVETNSYSAEYGRSNGGVIMVNHKSGSNDFHGTLFEFFRNEALNARNLFATTGPKPRFRRNQYGFVLGGPIQRNKTFFFVDWQGTRLQTGTSSGPARFPRPAQRQGVFSAADLRSRDDTPDRCGISFATAFPNNTIPADRFDPARRARAGPLSAAERVRQRAGGGRQNYLRVGNETTAQDQFDVRLDHNLNSSAANLRPLRVSARRLRPVTPLPDGSGNITTGVIGDTLTRADSVALSTPGRVGEPRSISSGSATRAGVSTAHRCAPDSPPRRCRGIPNIPAPHFRMRCRHTMSSASSNWVRRRTATRDSRLRSRNSSITSRGCGAATA